MKIKRKQFKILVSVIVIILILALILLLFYLQFRGATNIEREGFLLISQGRYTKGLERCLEKPYQVTPCYAFAFASMLAKNETIKKEFCESISLGDKLPFWNSEEKQTEYYNKIKKLKTQCYQVYFTKTLGITDVQQAQEFTEKNSNL